MKFLDDFTTVRRHLLLLVVGLSWLFLASPLMVADAFLIRKKNVKVPHLSRSHHSANRSLSPILRSARSSDGTTQNNKEEEQRKPNPFGALPVKEGKIEVTRSVLGGEQEEEITQTFHLSYTLVRPMSLSSRQGAPIVVLHGGPSVPSNYLYPLAKHVPYRSILFFDQLGCGQSEEPADLNLYSISNGIDDLEVILKKLGIRRFHLYGQSFGGILAYEYLKRCAERDDGDNNNDNDEGCLSVILSSTPSDVEQLEKIALGLIEDLGDPELLRKTHQCRTGDEMPEPLVDAYAAAGTTWRGTKAIHDYKAKAVKEGASRMPSAMILRGEYDFVTEECVDDWKNTFNSRSVRYKINHGCSHHGLLENGPVYGDVIDSFFAEYD